MKNYQIPSSGFVFTLPENWNEVTFGQYLAMAALKDRSALRVLELLVSNVSELRQTETATIASLYSEVAYLDGLAYVVKLPVPKKLAGIKRPKHAGYMSIGQSWGTADWAKELVKAGAEDDLFAWFLPAVAFFLTPRETPRLDVASTYVDQVLALPCTQAVPLAFWLYKGYQNPQPTGRTMMYSVPKDAPKESKAESFLRVIIHKLGLKQPSGRLIAAWRS